MSTISRGTKTRGKMLQVYSERPSKYLKIQGLKLSTSARPGCMVWLKKTWLPGIIDVLGWISKVFFSTTKHGRNGCDSSSFWRCPNQIPWRRLFTANQTLEIQWESWNTFKHIWLVVSTPLKNISQLGWLFPIYGKIKNVPNHQPDIQTCLCLKIGYLKL